MNVTLDANINLNRPSTIDKITIEYPRNPACGLIMSLKVFTDYYKPTRDTLRTVYLLLNRPFTYGLTTCIQHRWNRSGFLTTSTDSNKSDRTGPAGLPVWPVERWLTVRTAHRLVLNSHRLPVHGISDPSSQTSNEKIDVFTRKKPTF